MDSARPSGIRRRLAVVHEVWRPVTLEPGVTEFRCTVLRIEGARDGDGWAFTMTEQGTRIPWAPSVLTAGERADIEARLAMVERWQEEGEGKARVSA